MQLNHAKFRLNGGSGYVLKPDYMFDKIDTLSNTLTDNELQVTVFIISGRHIGRPGHNGIANPFVTVEIHGTEIDSGIKLNTRTISTVTFYILNCTRCVITIIRLQRKTDLIQYGMKHVNLQLWIPHWHLLVLSLTILICSTM